MVDLTGKKFGRLTVIGRVEGIRPPHWHCKCDCGGARNIKTGALQDKSRKNHSCGCAKIESIAKASVAAKERNTKFDHPHKNHLKWTFRNMVNRCHKPGTRRYERYGARGISVCDEWRFNPTAFYNWAVESGYEYGLWIERKDVNGNYCPENCTWKTPKEQANNTSRNRFIEWNGKRLTVSQWADVLGVNQKALQHRVDRNWPIERIFTQPFRRLSE